jgi:cell division transport system permease protein
MSFASISTVAASLFIFGIFMLMVVNVNNIIDTVEKKVEIEVFLKDDMTTLKQQKLEKDIKAIEGVREVAFKSKEQALADFRKSLGEKEDLAKGLDIDNPMPASFIIKVDKPQYVFDVSQKISRMNGIEQINDGKQLVESIIKVTNFIKVLSLILIVILGVIALSLISNTIKLTVFARKKEIGIMKYIGATDWFIRWPFVIEGMIMGFMGAVVSIIFLTGGYEYAVKTVSSSVAIFSLVSPGKVLFPMVWQFGLIGTAIGGFGSLISIRKFLVV